jgi:recombination protein RecA
MAPEDVLQVLDRPQPLKIALRAVPTGSLGLDLALGGGFPAGKITELYGGTGTGKTALAYHAAANAQELGTVVWADSGGNFDPAAARKAGVNLRDLVILPAGDVASTLYVMRMAAGDCSLIVLDTATGMPGIGNFRRELGLLVREIRDNGPAVVVTSNEKVSEATTGEFPVVLRDTVPVRIGLSRKGDETQATVVRNYATMPRLHQVRFRIQDGAIDSAYEMVLLALETGVLHKRGSWVYFFSARIGHGVNAAAKLLGDWPQARSEIREAVVACLI